MAPTVELECRSCGGRAPLAAPPSWRCACGAPWELPPGPPFDPARVDDTAPGLWRYRRFLRLPAGAPRPTLGEGHCPWLRLPGGPWAACAQLEPTGSFKARGAAVLVAWAATALAPPLIEDSSGNAGGALAAYAAAAGLACRVYVPASAPAGKRAFLERVGAEVVAVPGPRPRATAAALADADGSYCSHAWNPLFLEGIKTFAHDAWMARGDNLPARWYVPAGQGSLVLGLWAGFQEIAAGNPAFRPPALVAVQHAAVAPLHRRWQAMAAGAAAAAAAADSATGGGDAEATGDARAPGTATSASGTAGGGAPILLADGIAIPDPVRGDAVLAAVRDSGGDVLTVDDGAVREAADRLAARGLWVEPTGAVSLAGHHTAGDGDDAVVFLTGHGLKAS